MPFDIMDFFPANGLNTPMKTLVLFGGWTLLLQAGVFTWRTMLTLTGKFKANGFKSGQEHGGATYWRLNRAHMNAAENLPVVAAFVLGVIAKGAENDARINTFMSVLINARICQSLIHISSGSEVAVLFRFACALVQSGALFGVCHHLLMN